MARHAWAAPDAQQFRTDVEPGDIHKGPIQAVAGVYTVETFLNGNLYRATRHIDRAAIDSSVTVRSGRTVNGVRYRRDPLGLYRNVEKPTSSNDGTLVFSVTSGGGISGNIDDIEKGEYFWFAPVGARRIRVNFETYTFNGYYDDRINFGDDTIANQSWTTSRAIPDLTLPAATGAVGAISYELKPALPGGVALSGRKISGTPSGPMTSTRYEWIATDAANNNKVTLRFYITVIGPPVDVDTAFGDGVTIPSQLWRVGDTVSLDLPAAVKGNSPFNYALTPNLPAGLSLTARQIAGTLTTVFASTEFTWKVTDNDGDIAELKFTIEVKAADTKPTFGSQFVPSQQWIAGAAVVDLQLPSATGGNSPLTYALTPNLPRGLVLGADRRITGTPLETVNQTYTWKVTDEDGDAAEITFHMVVAGDIMVSFGDGVAVQNQLWRIGDNVQFDLPEAAAGNPPYTYKLTPEIPATTGLSLVGRRVSGRVTGTMLETEFAWRVTDTDGDTTVLRFDIEIKLEDTIPTFSGAKIDNQRWRQNQTMVSLQLPIATGGNGPLAHRLSQRLPAGVGVNLRTGLITGTPTVQFASKQYTWTAEDEDGDTVSLSFNIEVIEPNVPIVLPALPELTMYTGENNSYVLPAATGGNGAVTYRLFLVMGGRLVELDTTPSGRAEPAFDAATRTLTMNPERVVAGATVLEYRATDAEDDSISVRFNMLVTFRGDDTVPSFAPGASIPDQVWEQGKPITRFILPEATGGNPPLRPRFSPELPVGVSYNAITRSVSGTPQVFTLPTTISYIVEDANDDAAQLQFQIQVTEPDVSPVWPSGASIPNLQLTTGREMQARTLPQATGGNGALDYRIEPALIPGITLDTSTRRLSGTPTGVHDVPVVYRYYARDRDGDEIFLEFSIRVPDIPPVFSGQTIPNQNWKSHQDIGVITLPAATLGNPPVTYRLTPDLPEGVVFDPVARTLTGTPTSYMTNREFQYQAVDSDGDVATLKFRITVPNVVPDFGSATIPNQRWNLNRAIVALVLPLATGGNGVLTYDLSPALPSNMVFDLTKRRITGAPGNTIPSTQYIWKVTDADGQTDTITFTIEVPDLMPVFPPGASISDLIFNLDTAITQLRLPRATGGNPPLRHVLTPGLPSGIEFNQQGLFISGTPKFAFPETEFTYYAEDFDGDKTAELSFSVQVVTPPITFAQTNIPVQRWQVGKDIDLLLPAATGGDGGDLEYSIAVSPPLGGISFNSGSRRITGQPSKRGNYTVRYTAQDSSGTLAFLTFTAVVASQPLPTYESFVPIDGGGDRTIVKASAVTTTDRTENAGRTEDEDTDEDDGGTPGPVDPTQPDTIGLEAYGHFRRIRLEWHDSPTPGWELQVSESGIASEPWYALRSDGVDWKGTEDAVTAVTGNYYDHVVNKDGLTLWYRIRKTGFVDWSSPTNATTELDVRQPEIPTGLAAFGQGRQVRIDWTTPPVSADTPPISHWEIQVAAGAGGPWYALENNGTDWRGAQNEWTYQSANYYTHFAIPILGTDARPTTLTLHYRIRAVSTAGIKSDWSEPVSATAMGLTKGDLADNIVDAAKIDPEGFLQALDEDLLAWWGCDETTSDVITDISGRGGDLAVQPARRPTSIPGPCFRALDFADRNRAANGDVEYGPDGAPSRFSVSFWARIDAHAGTVVQWGGYRFALGSSNRLQFLKSGRLATAVVTGLTGSWHHFVGVSDGSTDGLKIYVDGLEQNVAITRAGALAPSTKCTFGGFNGGIDEMRLYDKALDVAEIRFLTLVPGGPGPGMLIADKIIAKSITARHLEADILQALVAEIQSALFVGPNGFSLEGVGRTVALGDIESYIDNDQLTIRRALRANPTSPSHWELLAQIHATGREAELELWDRGRGQHMTFSRTGLEVGTNTVNLKFNYDGLEINRSTSRYIRIDDMSMRLNRDGDTYISLDHVNGLRIYDGTRRVDMDPDEIRIQASTTKYVSIKPDSIQLRNGGAVIRLATLDDIPDDTNLDNYVTKSSLSSQLASYVTNSGIRTLLNTYATDSEVAQLLRNYPTEAELQRAIANLPTNSEITRQLSAYARISQVPRSKNAILTLIGPGGITADFIAANAIDTKHLKAGSVDLGSATVTGTLTADHIDADVLNVRPIWAGTANRVTPNNGLNTSYQTISRNTNHGADYIMAVCSIGIRWYIVMFPRSTSQRRTTLIVDTTRALDVDWVAGGSYVAINDTREHVELGGSDIGTLSVRALWGVFDPR